MAGSRSYILKGPGALLEMALTQLAMDRLVGKGFTPLIVPALVREFCLVGSGQFPSGREQTYELPADGVFLLTGYHPDVELMRNAGINVDDVTLAPDLNMETFETNVPNLFIAGGAIAGKKTGNIFIENGRFHGEKIVAELAKRLRAD